MSTRLDIVIVNYRTASLTVDCLRSLESEAAALPGMRVWVVDNCSSDGSAETIAAAIERHGWSAWAIPLPLDYNGGFSAGNNAAIRLALAGDDKPEFVFLLNPDTVVKPGAVVTLLRYMQEHPKTGIAGAKLLNAQGIAEPSAHLGLSPWSELDAGARLGVITRLLKNHRHTLEVTDEVTRCDWVSGAALMIRREVMDQIGLLDEGYFLYFDEVDYCMRARRAGWEVWFVPTSVITHLEGASTQIGQVVKRRAPYWFKSRRRYFTKAYGVAGLIAADLLFGIGRLSLVIRRALRLGGSLEGTPKLFAWDLLSGDFRALIAGRLVEPEPAPRPCEFSGARRRMSHEPHLAVVPPHGAAASSAAGAPVRAEPSGPHS